MQVTIGKYRIEGSVLAAMAAVVFLLVVLVCVTPGRKAAPEVPVSEALAVSEAQTIEMESTKIGAYESGDRRRQGAGDSPDSLWLSLNAPLPEGEGGRNEGSSLSRVFGITDDMLAEPPAQVRIDEPRRTGGSSARGPSAPVNEPRVQQHEAGQQMPVAETAAVQPAQQSGVSSLVTGSVSSSGVGEIPEKLIRCMFIRDEKVRSGQRVQIRLLEDLRVDGSVIPANSHLTALCTIGDRLQLEVASLQVNGSIIRAGYRAYDSDGMEGLYCPDTETSMERAARSSQGSVISAGGSALSQALTGLLSAGVNAGTGVVARAASRDGQTVQVSAGYRFYLLRKTEYNLR